MPYGQVGGSGSGGLSALFDSGFLGGDAASIDTGANGIVGGHINLLVIGYLRSTAASTNDNVNITFNNDSSAIYSVNRIQNINTTLGGTTGVAGTSSTVGTFPAATATANYFGTLRGFIPMYDGTSNFKTGEFVGTLNDAVAADNILSVVGIGYGSTTAITRLKIVAAGGNLKAGSRLIIYGTQ